jgi:L-asparaginase
MNDILFLQTGGTVDKDYPPGKNDHGYAFVIGKPAYELILERSRAGFRWSTKCVLKKDSQDFVQADHERIAEEVVTSRKKQIIITHGTDTIKKTAKTIDAYENGKKVIVLTGSLLPERFKETDADFNLGMAIAAVQWCPPGVYIALYGKVTPWDEYIAL